MSILTTLNDVPQHQAVLTAINGPIDIRDRDGIIYPYAVIEQSNKHVSILSEKTARDKKELKHLIAKLSGQGYEVGSIIDADVELVQMLNASDTGTTWKNDKSMSIFDELIFDCVQNKSYELRIILNKNEGVANVYHTVYMEKELVRQMRYTQALTMLRANFNACDSADERNDSTFDEYAIRQWTYDLKDVAKARGYNNIKARITSIPLVNDCLVLAARIAVTKTTEDYKTLGELGFSSEQLRSLKAACSRASGAVIIAGPTGSGKTFTSTGSILYRHQIHPHAVMMSIDAPVEHVLSPDIVEQQSLSGDGDILDRSFSNYLRADMRATPDAIFLGEVRDSESANLFIRAIETGHYVQTTLHADNYQQAIARLNGLGADASDLLSLGQINAIVSQRLVKTLCNNCRLPIKESLEYQDERVVNACSHLNQGGSLNLYGRGNGCSNCQMRGIDGLTLVAEVAVPRRDDPCDIKLFKREDHAKKKLVHGNISVLDYLLLVGDVA